MSAPLDSRQLRAFHVLARTGSFTQTARELRRTQSGISHAMKALETETGCRLLDRLGKKVVLSAAGEQLLQHTEKILLEMEAARESLALLEKRGRTRLRLGASATACQHLIPPVLRAFQESFPDHTLSLEPADTPQLVASLIGRRIDLALTLEADHEPQLEFHPLFNDQLQFIVSPRHPWAQAGRVERSEIPGQNYLLPDQHRRTLQSIENYFRHEKLAPANITEAGSLEAVKELIKLRLGISILAPWVAHQEIADGSLVALPLGRKKLSRRWGILNLRGRHFSQAEETFIRLCKTATLPLRTRVS